MKPFGFAITFYFIMDFWHISYFVCAYQTISKPSTEMDSLFIYWKCCIIQVELEFTIKSILYNTTEAYYKCSLGNRLCSLRLSLGGTFAAILTSPGHTQVIFANFYSIILLFQYIARFFNLIYDLNLHLLIWSHHFLFFQDSPDDDWYVKLSYGPRWLTYFLGAGKLLFVFQIFLKRPKWKK